MEGQLASAGATAAESPADELPFDCRCGQVAGRLRGVSPVAAHRAVCYCESCQAFPRLIDSADDVLDANGGTELLHISSAHLEITRGAEQLACLRITSRGPLRWYARCCSTPIANCAAQASLPFLGLIVPAGRAGDRREACARLLGPVRFRVQAQDAVGDVSHLGARKGFGLPILWRLARLTLGAWLRGEHARSPFFDPASRQPIAEPRMISAEERERVRR